MIEFEKGKDMLKVFSFGGGQQSTAALVLAAQSRIDFKTFLFCNVGDDSEHPDTLKYVHEIAMPYAKSHGIDLIELQKIRQDGSVDTIYQRLTRPNSRSIGIPVRMSNGAPGNRTCTTDFKIEVVDKWLRERLIATYDGLRYANKQKQREAALKRGAVVALGISLDEWHRMRTDSGVTWKQLAYPLIDLRLDRQDCRNIIEGAGLPIPPKSACYFCPLHRFSTWQEMRHKQPALFQKACELEEMINRRRDLLGKDHVWFSDRLK